MAEVYTIRTSMTFEEHSEEIRLRSAHLTEVIRELRRYFRKRPTGLQLQQDLQREIEIFEQKLSEQFERIHEQLRSNAGAPRLMIQTIKALQRGLPLLWMRLFVLGCLHASLKLAEAGQEHMAEQLLMNFPFFVLAGARLQKAALSEPALAELAGLVRAHITWTGRLRDSLKRSRGSLEDALLERLPGACLIALQDSAEGESFKSTKLPRAKRQASFFSRVLAEVECKRMKARTLDGVALDGYAARQELGPPDDQSEELNLLVNKARLSPCELDVLRMRLADQTLGQIAADSGLCLGSVKSLLARARKKIFRIA